MVALLDRFKLKVTASQVAAGVERIMLESALTRLQGFPACCYLVGDLLIDSGFVKIARQLDEYLAQRRLAAILLTHHHEDHAGCCGLLAERHGCPVYLSKPERRGDEGLEEMALYRRIWWGRPHPYRPEPMPAEVSSGGRCWRCLPTPGHSATHCAFFEPASKVLFCGDLFITGGVSAVMTHENPYQLVESLRSLAELEPRVMFNGHGAVIEQPARLLRDKAEALEGAARRAFELHQLGLGTDKIVAELFRNGGQLRDRLMAWFTAGEFSRANLVRACIAHRPSLSG